MYISRTDTIPLVWLITVWKYLHRSCSYIFYVALRPNAGQGLLVLEVSRSHTTTHHSRWDSSGQVISTSQRPLPNTQHSQQRDIHAPGGIRTHDLSSRAAVDPRLRPRGQWHRRYYVGYSESKYRLRISLTHPRDSHFAHVQWLPLSTEKPQTPFREIRVMFMFVPCVKHVYYNWRGRRLWNTVCNSFFLNAKNVLPSEINHQIFQVCGDNATSDGMVRKWVRMFNVLVY